MQPLQPKTFLAQGLSVALRASVASCKVRLSALQGATQPRPSAASLLVAAAVAAATVAAAAAAAKLPLGARPYQPPAAAMEEQALQWDALPFSAITAIVQHVQCLPLHQAAWALAAARLLCHHWRRAVDDATTEWRAPPGVQCQAVAAVLSRWRHLRRLVLDSCTLDAAALGALSGCRRLERVRLLGVDAPARQLCAALAQLPRLAELEYAPGDGGPAGPSFAPLAACTSLRSLSFDSCWGWGDLQVSAAAVCACVCAGVALAWVISRLATACLLHPASSHPASLRPPAGHCWRRAGSAEGRVGPAAPAPRPHRARAG